MNSYFEYQREGAVHEAGHAVLRAYLRLPFEWVTIRWDKETGSRGYVHVLPRVLSGRTAFYKRAKSVAAGRCATDLYGLHHPENPLLRYPESDRDDIETLREMAQQIDRDFEDFQLDVFEETERILRIPHVWASVETLARELQIRDDVAGDDLEYTRVSSREVRNILRDSKLKVARCLSSSIN